MIWMYGIILPLVGSVAYAQGTYTTTALKVAQSRLAGKAGTDWEGDVCIGATNLAPMWNIAGISFVQDIFDTYFVERDPVRFAIDDDPFWKFRTRPVHQPVHFN